MKRPLKVPKALQGVIESIGLENTAHSNNCAEAKLLVKAKRSDAVTVTASLCCEYTQSNKAYYKWKHGFELSETESLVQKQVERPHTFATGVTIQSLRKVAFTLYGDDGTAKTITVKCDVPAFIKACEAKKADLLKQQRARDAQFEQAKRRLEEDRKAEESTEWDCEV